MATHNSYAGGGVRSIREQLDAGARVVELDLYADDFESRHDYWLGHDSAGSGVLLGVGNPASPAFTAWLQAIRSWSDQHRDHAPIVIVIDLKPGLIDEALQTALLNCEAGKGGLTDKPSFAKGNLTFLNDRFETVFGDLLYRSDAFHGQWPDLNTLRGHLLFVLSGDACTRREYRWDEGSNPSVALNSKGQVVEVHDSGAGALWYWTGRCQRDGTVRWRRHGKYDTGQRAAVALNDDGWIVEVHQTASRLQPALFYQVGKLDENDEVHWAHRYSGTEYDHGIEPTVRFKGPTSLELEEIHRSEWHSQNWRWVGRLNPNDSSVSWSHNAKTGDPQFDKGRANSGTQEVRVFVAQDPAVRRNVLFYGTSLKQARIQYEQVGFVEYQKGESESLLSDGAPFVAAAAEPAENAIWAIQQRKQGKIVRLWQFNRLSPVIQDAEIPPANLPATDTPYEVWYRDYCAAIGTVR